MSLRIVLSDGHSVNVERSLIEKYESSDLFGYLDSINEDTQCLLDDISSEEFHQIHCMMRGEILETDLSDDLWTKANKHGLTNDFLFALKSYRLEAITKQTEKLKNEMSKELIFVEGLLKSSNRLCLVDDPKDYDLYTRLLKNNHSIVPIQAILNGQGILYLFIYAGIPVIFPDVIAGNKIVDRYPKDLSGVVNVNDLRYLVYLSWTHGLSTFFESGINWMSWLPKNHKVFSKIPSEYCNEFMFYHTQCSCYIEPEWTQYEKSEVYDPITFDLPLGVFAKVKNLKAKINQELPTANHHMDDISTLFGFLKIDD